MASFANRNGSTLSLLVSQTLNDAVFLAQERLEALVLDDEFIRIADTRPKKSLDRTAKSFQIGQVC